MDSQQLSQQLKSFRKNRSTGSGYLKKASGGLGISDARTQGLQGALQGTEQSFMNADSSVTGRTQGSLVSEAQRRSIVDTERAPIAEAFRSQSDALSTEMGHQQALRGEASSRAGQLYSRDESVQSSLQKQYKKKLASEDEAKRRQAERQKYEKMLGQMRQSLDQSRRLADLSRQSDERIAQLDRLSKYGFS